MRNGRRLSSMLLVAMLLAVVILVIPHATFAQTGGFKLVPECARQANPGPTGETPPPPSLSCLLQVFGNIAQIILGLTGSLALLMFVYAGFTMLTAAGNEQRVTKGKEILKTAIIGIVIIFTAGTIIRYGLSSLVKPNLVVGQDCPGGTVIQKTDGTLTCGTTCSSAGNGYTCIATSQVQNRACVGKTPDCAANQLCCQTGPTIPENEFAPSGSGRAAPGNVVLPEPRLP